MSKLYPLLMKPLFDPRPWGRLDLAPIYAQKFQEKIGESWLTGDHCQVANGPLAGKRLSELAVDYRRLLVGDAPADDRRFPLLLKFLFPEEKLSVQVHPDDSAAREIGEPCGKTECWYVAHAEPRAQIALGLKPGVTRAEFERSIHDQRAEQLLNWIHVFPGDMIYVAGGTVHTLGPGSIMVETQQQSDTTFRLYDYGRPRELHLEAGLRVIKEQVRSGKVRPQPITKLDGNGNERQLLVAGAYFAVEKFSLAATQQFPPLQGNSSVQILVAIDGAARFEAASYDGLGFQKGDGLVVPASIGQFRIQPHPRIEFLRAFVPGAKVPEPEVFLE